MQTLFTEMAVILKRAESKNQMTVLQTKNKIKRLFPLHLLGQQIVNMPIQKQLQLNIFLTTKSQAFKGWAGIVPVH